MLENVGSKVVREALRTVEAADLAFRVALAKEYPVGSSVTVTHARGMFEGYVDGYDVFSRRIWVVNAITGKRSKWHFSRIYPPSKPGETPCATN